MKSASHFPYRIVPAEKAEHLKGIAQITADAFAGGQHVEEISRTYFDNCHYDWNTSRLAFDGERLIHHWGVWGYPMRLDSIQVKVAGVGAVVTLEEYRKQGLMRLAALDSFKAMKQNGYDLSILRGRHYAKFGYVRAWNYVTYRLNTEEIPKFALKQPYEALGPKHMDEIIARYNQDYTDFSGTVVRPTYHMLEAGDMGTYGWFENGRLTSYVRAEPSADKKSLQCLEATGNPEQGLAVLLELFQKGQYETLAFFTLPHQHPILQIIRRGACLVEDKYFYHSGWQVKIINLQSTIAKLSPVLEDRLKHSQFANWNGVLGLGAENQQITLSITGGRLKVTDRTAEHNILGGAALGRLLIGSDEPNEIIQQEQITCTGQGFELAHVLFPNLHPVMSHWDEY